ncbi:MAG: hypothetical protein ACLQDV_28315 [Candidatus Binataceae bacterium]
MKLRHAATLALVGWYLVVPPLNNGYPNMRARFSQWETVRSFYTVDDCEISKSELQTAALERRASDQKNPAQADIDRRLFDAICAANAALHP